MLEPTLALEEQVKERVVTRRLVTHPGVGRPGWFRVVFEQYPGTRTMHPNKENICKWADALHSGSSSRGAIVLSLTEKDH